MIDRRHFFTFSALAVLWLGTTGLTAPQPLSPLAPASVQADTVQPVRAPHGMVVSESVHASKAGADVLAAGGNAVDAAIATGLALAVTHPSAGNIGGGGFMVIRFPDGATTALDFREKAPLASHPEMWLDESGEYSRTKHHDSHMAVGVPGTIAGFWKAHRLYGGQEWRRLVSPAVGLARDGFEISKRLARGLQRLVEGRGAAYVGTVASFSMDGRPFEPGYRLVQTDLAQTLERIANGGRDGFYEGETARLLAAEMERGGGIITLEDLARYQAKERTPIKGHVQRLRHHLHAASVQRGRRHGPDAQHPRGLRPRPPWVTTRRDYIHHLTEAMRRAYRDRARFVADIDFVDVPVHRLTSKAYAEHLRADIDPLNASVSAPSDVTEPYESPETTHYSVVDRNGMAVSVTYTLESGYGSAITVPGAGFLLHNEMGDFNAGPGLTDDGGLIRYPAESRASGAAHALQHDAEHRNQGRRAGCGGGEPGRPDDHQHRHAGDPELRRVRDEHPGGRQRASATPPVAPRQRPHRAGWAVPSHRRRARAAGLHAVGPRRAGTRSLHHDRSRER